MLTIMMYFSSPPPFFLTLSQWIHILSSLLRHLPWPLWYSLLMTLPVEKTETIRKDSPQKTWHHINLPVDISVQILSHLLLPIYYCEWTVLYGQGQPIHPCSRSHLLSSLFSAHGFHFFFFFFLSLEHLATTTQKLHLCGVPKCSDFSALKAPVYLIFHSSRSETLTWELSTPFFQFPKTWLVKSCLLLCKIPTNILSIQLLNGLLYNFSPLYIELSHPYLFR